MFFMSGRTQSVVLIRWQIENSPMLFTNVTIAAIPNGIRSTGSNESPKYRGSGSATSGDEAICPRGSAPAIPAAMQSA